MVLRQTQMSPALYGDVDDTPAEYLTQTEGDARYALIGSGGGVTAHSALTGLVAPADDHTQYHNDTRGDARYYTKSAADTLLAAKSDTTHNHAHNSLTGLTTGDPHTQYAKLAGDTFTGDVVVQGTGKAYRFRRSGSALDFEGGGTDMYLSIWANSDFTGAQNIAAIIRTTGIVDFQNAITATKVTNGFAAAFAEVATLQTTTSTTYTDLTTAGPAVTITVPTGGMRVKITVGCELAQQSTAARVYMGYAVSGSTTIAATDTTAVMQNGTGLTDQYSHVSVVTLSAGSNTITAKYRTASGTAQFSNRKILVEPLPT